MDISYYIDKIIVQREIIRKYDDCIKQDLALIKRYKTEGNEEGVKFWRDVTKKVRSWRRDSEKFIEDYLDIIEEIRKNEKNEQQ